MSAHTSRTATFASFDALLEANQTRALVVVRDDVLMYERYFGGHTEATLLPAFSISKTLAALLVGCAIDDRLLEGVHQRLVTFVPGLTKPGYRDITLDHLLRMTSGISFDEESTAGAVLYYSTDLRWWMTRFRVRWPPGSRYAYGSINVQLLWEVLHRRLGDKTVASYFEEHLWQPMGAEFPATWSLDSDAHGVEKLFGGFNAAARDYARLGWLMLNRGRVDGRVVVSESWIEASLVVDPVPGTVHTTDGDVLRGKYQWFVTKDGRAYFAKGYRGQYVFVVPSRRTVIVRFGEGYGDVDWTKLFLELADTL